MTATYTRYWLSDGWILHPDPAKSAKYRISGKWIWGPVGAGNANTGHWISEGYIWGPAGSTTVYTGFYISDGHIYGPSLELPFAK